MVLVAICGALGLVTIPLIEIEPTPATRWPAVAAIVLVLVVAIVVRRHKPHRAMDELKPLLRNPARTGRKPWLIVDKQFSLTVPDSGGLGRDAHIDVQLVVLNNSKRLLGTIEFPISGSNRIRQGDLDVTANVGGLPAMQIDVRYVDGNSPIGVVPMPAPGLNPRDTIGIRLQFLWPGMANMLGGT